MKKTDAIPCEVVKDLLPLYLKKQYYTFAEVRSEAERLQKLVFQES